MKQKYFLTFLFTFLTSITLMFSQSRGSIAFTAINVDGDDDFAIVTLADIAANTTIYFTDYEWDEVGTTFTETGTDGFLDWNTGSDIIKAGTIVVFTDVDNSSNTNYGVSIGTLTSPENVTLIATGETFFAYTGTDKDTPTTFITGIKNGTVTTDLTGTALGGVDLAVGTDFLEFNPTVSPDGGFFSGSRSNQASYNSYLAILTNKANWTHNTSNGEATLPISKEAFTINSTTWTGASSSVWNLAGNWNNGIPTSSSLVSIPDVATSPIISSGTTANAGNVIIAASELLTINAANALTVSGNLTITGDLTINSGGSLIINGTSTGNLTYNVNVADTDWHLVASPVIGEQYDDAWNTANSINVSGAGLNDAVSTYNNTTSASGSWDYFQTGGAATTFNQGQGYSLKRTGAGDYGFIGTFPTNDVILSITQGFGALNKWNLVGNPFPSYIRVSELIAANTANLTDTHEFIYVWNGTNYATLAGTDYIHTGQAFFVNADNSTADNFTIAESLQSHQTGITFYKAASDPKIEVFVNDNESQKFTEIRYVENTTKALDPGFDAGTFTGEKSDFSLYSHLVSNSDGVDFMLQSLPKDDYENTIIPLGLNAISGKEVTFTINHQNLPNGLMVFLEDKEKEIITRLDENNSDYKITLDSDSNGSGRFYLRTSTTDLRKTLDINDFNFDQVNVYLSSERNLRISGLKSDKAVLTIFNILGKKVYNQNLNSSTSIDINLSHSIKQGIYIVKIETEKGNINKKIFLK